MSIYHKKDLNHLTTILNDNPVLNEAISDPIIMLSNAGYYVGIASMSRMEDGEYFVAPYDRLSEYAATPEVAEIYLSLMEA